MARVRRKWTFEEDAVLRHAVTTGGLFIMSFFSHKHIDAKYSL